MKSNHNSTCHSIFECTALNRERLRVLRTFPVARSSSPDLRTHLTRCLTPRILHAIVYDTGRHMVLLGAAHPLYDGHRTEILRRISNERAAGLHVVLHFSYAIRANPDDDMDDVHSIPQMDMQDSSPLGIASACSSVTAATDSEYYMLMMILQNN